MHISKALPFTSALLMLASVSSAGRIYVDIQRTTGNNDGTSWQNAFKSPLALQDALSASSSGDIFWIAEGTYVPDLGADRFASFDIWNTVRLIGGFRGNEVKLADRPPIGEALTILSGDLAGDDDLPAGSMDENAVRVIYIPGNSLTPVFDRLVITGGNSIDLGSTSLGAGLYSGYGAVPTVIDCTFTNHQAAGGSAVFLDDSLGAFYGCTFEQNVASSHSTIGGMFRGNLLLDRCKIINNEGGRGAALGLIPVTPGGVCTISNSLIEGNLSTFGDQGVIYLGSAQHVPAVRMINCTVVGNRSTASNNAGLIASSGVGEVRNCIFWGNRGQWGTAATTIQLSSFLTPDRCIVEGGHPGGSNIIDMDPRFVDAPNGDYSLASSSPAIDHGANDALDVDAYLDQSRRRRFQDDPATPDTGIGLGPIVDLGAIEFTANLGFPFCRSEPNSTTGRGTTDATGALSISDNDFTLNGAELPTGAVGFFLASQTQRSRVTPMNSQGALCLGGAIGRFVGPGQVQTASLEGTIQLAVDLTNLPQPAQSVAAIPGETWFFQAWHRDSSPAGATSNFTDALQVTFEP